MSDDDIRLEEELRRAARLFDPVPARLVRLAVAAYTFRTVDAELAELTFDSLAEHNAELVRGPEQTQSRLLSFDAHTLTVDVEIMSTGAGRRLIGQIHPGQRAEVDIRGRDRSTTVTTDDLGRFSCEEVRHGLLGLRCRTTQETVVTDWVSI
jgi:hypothetical protein